MDCGSVLWLFILTGFCSYGNIHAKQWFVSRVDGTSATDCGLQASHPCKTVHQAIVRAHDGDVINVDGTGTSRDPYLCESDSVTEEELNIPGVVMRSYKTRAFIACKKKSFRFSCDSRINVSLKGITFVNTSLYFVECSLKMADCNFVDESDTGLSLSFALNSTANIYLNGCSFQNNSATSLKISGNSVRLNISNSSFANNTLHNVNDTIFAMSTDLQAQQISRFTVNFSNITVSQNSCPSHACFEIVAGVNGKLTLEMDQVSFENNQAGESLLDVHGSSNAYIEFKSTQFRKNAGRAINLHDGNSLKLKIMRGTFYANEIGKRKNGGAVSVSGFTRKAFVSLSRSDFISNKAAENGGACAFYDMLLLILDVESCQFVQNEAWVSGGALSVGSNYRWQVNATVDIRSSHFSSNILHFLLYDTCTRYKECSFKSGDNWPADVGGGGALALYVLNMGSLSLVNCTFVNNTAQEKNSGAIRAQLGTLYMDTVVLSCEFIRNSGGLLSSTIQLTVSNPLLWAFQPRVIIRHSKFLENKGNSTSVYDIYLFPSYLIMSSCTLVKNSGGGIFFGTYSNTSNILVENSLMSDNLNFAFYIYTDPNKISYGSRYQFKNVSFINNNCQTWSSIFRVSMYPSQSFLHFQASTFLDNFCKAGVVKISVVPSSPWTAVKGPENAWVTFNNSEFRGNSGVAESAVTIFDVKAIDIQNTNFTNNFGSTDGSHVRVQMRSSELTIYKTNFYQSKESQVSSTSREQPYNGFLTVTSFGNISIRESSFVSDPFSADGEALVFVKGAHKVVMNDSVRIKSPFSSKLNLHNFTHQEYVSDYVQTLIVSFSLSTESCPMGTYSINRGSSEGFTIENHVKCLACPTGGNCTSVLSARHNFWGYPIGDKVYFKFCPQGYCCPAVNQRCPYHNSSYLHSGCQGNRTGFLCGRCKKDFSDTLFTTNCLPVKDCTHYWYLIIIFICTSSFALFLVQKPPVFEMLMRNLTWFLPRREKTDSEDYQSLDSDAKTDSDTSSGYFKIIFYFYQIGGVLTASSYGVREVLKDNIVLPLVSLLDFKISIHNNWSICPFPGITPLKKTLFQLVAVIAIFLSIPVIYLLHSGLNKLRKRTPALPPCGPYLAATVEIVLLGYSAATGTAMKLLNCVQIQHVSRWYYDAEITCFQWWQNASFAGIALFLFPFIFTLYFASLQLYKGQISAKIFLLACVFPLPYLLLVFVSHLNKVIAQRRDFREMVSPSSVVGHDDEVKCSFASSTIEHAVLQVLTAPFCKPRDNHSTGKVYWDSVLIGRRFVLILIGSFLEYAFLRSVCLTILCLVFLLHHVYQKPFVQFRANLAETVSLATLVAIAILNVGVTSYYSVGIEARGVQQQYVRFFHLTEAVLMGFAPFLFVVFVFLSLVSQLVRLAIILIQATRWLIFKSKTCNHRPQLSQVQPLLAPES